MHMGVTVSVISGKGGTGKTTLCAGIAACLAAEGKRVLCIDADIGLRNLDIALGMAEQPAVAFTDVTQGFCKLSDAAEHPALPGLFLLTAPVREQDALVEQQRFGALLREAREAFDWVLIDAAAGIGTSFRLATQFADRCIVAATPDPASLRDAACAADALALEGHELLQLVVYRDRRAYPHRLCNAIEQYDLQDRVTNSHRAIDDVRATVEVLRAMETERDDLERYVDLFGYSSKYGISGPRISSVRYLPQGYEPKAAPLYAGL